MNRQPHRLFALVLGLILGLCSIPSQADAIGLGDSFPGMTLTDLDGSDTDLDNPQNSVMLLYFMGSGCNACIDISRQIDSDFSSYSGEALRIYGIDSLDGGHGSLERTVQESGARFPFLVNGSALVRACGIAWHSIVVVDKNGYVRYIQEDSGNSGSVYDRDELTSVVDTYLRRHADIKDKTWGAIKNLYGR